ncbi:tyrosine-type recombinase/integrase [Rhodococcus indonesiensis]|uniref:tyrosine-type recombinase/integrase n=1 Tax=Rhodococcus indonesiensis TaxID=3055869 RepID=UPI0039F70C7B
MPSKKTPPKRTRRAFGAIRKLPSGRWQANYTGPDLRIHKAPSGTFHTRDAAVAWVDSERKLIDLDVWTPPAERAAAEAAAASRRPPTFGEYAARVIDERDLAPRTKDSYKYLLREHLAPTFGAVPLDGITPALVRTWWGGVRGVRHAEAPKIPTARVRAYEVLRMVLNVAVEDDLIPSNPCRITAATRLSPAHDATMPTPAEVAALADAMAPELALSVLITAWCGLRRSETFELRRRDVSADCAVLSVTRAVTTRNGITVVARPKAGSVRQVVIPPHIRSAVAAHLDTHTGKAQNALLFPDPRTGEHLPEWTYRKRWNVACEAIGRPGLRVHELRHFGGTIAAQAGGTLREVQDRLGHKTAAAAMRYQRLAAGRADQLAEQISRLAES